MVMDFDLHKLAINAVCFGTVQLVEPFSTPGISAAHSTAVKEDPDGCLTGSSIHYLYRLIIHEGEDLHVCNQHYRNYTFLEKFYNGNQCILLRKVASSRDVMCN